MSFGSIPDKHYAEWVAKLPSLSNVVTAITGTTSGTGYWTAVAAIRRNAKAIVLLNRESAKSKAALEKLEEEKQRVESTTALIPVTCNLLSFDSVKNAAEETNAACAKFGGLNVLANNAGIMAFPDERSKDGYDVQMQTNHLSHFLLAKLLMPSFQMAVEGGGEVRVCQHSSGARRGKPLEAKYFEQSEAGKLGGSAVEANFARYHQTKLSNSVFAMALHKKLQEKGFDVEKFKSVVAEPGVSATDLGTNLKAANQTLFSRLKFKLVEWQFRYFTKMQSAADGALPLIEACFGEDVDSGDFFHPKEVRVGIPYKAISKGALAEGNNKAETETLSDENQELVWAKTEEVHGDFFEFAK